ncbi:hypothetical protein BH24ACI5_BH24ACI5_20210 [soil metagenome]
MTHARTGPRILVGLRERIAQVGPDRVEGAGPQVTNARAARKTRRISVVARSRSDGIDDLRSKRIECDEIWQFCYTKAKNVTEDK